MVLKLHRLGRTSFRAVKSKRDYLKHRKNFNWLYLSRLAALKEFAFMKTLEEHEFPVPDAVDCNRHCVVMSLVQGFPLYFDRDVECIFKFFRKRFNISYGEEIKESDNSKVGKNKDGKLCFSSIEKSSGTLDVEFAASGFTKKDQEEFEKIVAATAETSSELDDEDDTDFIDSDSDDETTGERVLHDVNTISKDINSLKLDDQQDETASSDENDEDLIRKEAVDTDEPETLQASEKEEEKRKEEEEVFLKQSTSRNTYKDKGERSLAMSKHREQLLVRGNYEMKCPADMDGSFVRLNKPLSLFTIFRQSLSMMMSKNS